LQAEFGARELLMSPEVVQVLDNAERLTRSTERYAAMIEKLPAERDAAIVQMFNELSRERQEAITQIMQQEREAIKALLVSDELQSAVANIGSEGKDIANKTFIRGVLLIVLWGAIFLGARVLSDILIRKLHRKEQHTL
jgi:hypothetical protein